jgi:hypothetical protein
LANLGFENEGLAVGSPQNANSPRNIPLNMNSPRNVNSPRNIDLGEGELKGSIAAANNKNKAIKLNSIPTNELGQAGRNSLKAKKEVPAAAIAPSPINTFDSEEPTNVAAPPSDLKKLSQEAEEVTSLQAPLTPPSGNEDIEVESISNSLTPEQKVSGGGRGGSMMSAMARTTYTLAPAAALLATAAMVMKGRKRSTRKHSKKSRKTHRRRR